MDPVRFAKVRAFVDSSCLPPGRGADELKYEKQTLSEARRKRALMSFTERMEADAGCQHAYHEVMDMRKNEPQRKALDKMVERMRPVPPLKEPKVIRHDWRALFNSEVSRTR
ncbi:unnamed protein product [Effrenium voratum]|uniref:Uncharacterized protein n=1 Tax=Effrenium voratum TaxID=2562239 RepID=A0AA36I388_9DINO|nr:unnamed protein product [Effrenium voratum]CAJ1456596.1 unnamed protein product [Effrenium voratum]CAJ1462149.1 unnamed protein product [Effrenium voratum]